LNNCGLDIFEDKIRYLFDDMDQEKDGMIDYLDLISFLNPMDLTMGPLTQFLEVPILDDTEKEQLKNMIFNRLVMLATAAAKHNVALRVDAEQTYMQPSIDHLVLNLQRKYNQEHQVIFNTFQCYLKVSSHRVKIDLERAKRDKFKFACKLRRYKLLECYSNGTVY
jgi:proline dehydrogenase